MQTIEFETKVVDGVVKIPKEYTGIYNAQVKVTIIKEDKSDDFNQKQETLNINPKLNFEEYDVKTLDFSKYNINCFKNINPIEYQRGARDEK